MRSSGGCAYDLETGNYLFGRGTMDMKMGLALHMQLIEKASVEKWPINLLLTTVPDEEVNSAGMRAAVTELVRIREEQGLTYKLFLNSEPSFSQNPTDIEEYVYSGTIGKIMPAALFYGKETHVGEPIKGMTANYIASYLDTAHGMERIIPRDGSRRKYAVTGFIATKRFEASILDANTLPCSGII